jgi:hypothetical protein
MRGGSGREGFLRRIAGRLKLLLVPEDCQGNQGDRDDPQNDVFAAILFVCHKSQYSIPEITVQVSS